MGITQPAVVNSAWVKAVEGAWTAIRRNHADVPAVHLALGQVGKSVHKWAHFGSRRPVAELWLSYQMQTSRSGEQQMATLLHEAAHGVADARELRDTSNRNRHHNSVFANLAAELGLYLSPERPADLGADGLTVAAAKLYAPQIRALAKASPVAPSRAREAA